MKTLTDLIIDLSRAAAAKAPREVKVKAFDKKGREVELHITGLAQDPEHVFIITASPPNVHFEFALEPEPKTPAEELAEERAMLDSDNK